MRINTVDALSTEIRALVHSPPFCIVTIAIVQPTGPPALPKMVALEEISAPPVHVSPEQLDQLQQNTPSSIEQIPPVLHLHIAQSTVYLSPSPSSRPSCFEQLKHNHPGNGHIRDGDDGEDEQAEVFQAKGQLWLTEREVAFLAPKTATGFRLGYPNVALHAVTRTPPSFLATTLQNGSSSQSSTPAFHGCLYCQLDLSPNAGTAEMGEDDQQGEFVEMYICTPNSASLDQLFESLSHCASLHPSGAVDEDAGHPFASFAPFGTSASGLQLGEDQDGNDAFDDAEVDDGDDGEQGLSETGRVRADFQTPDSRYRPY